MPYIPFTRVDVDGVERLSAVSRTAKHHVKSIKPQPRRRLEQKVPLLDCFTAPCKNGCPIGQDIPEYVELVRQGKYTAALRLIMEKNPLPFITGTICAHRCMSSCTRNFYDTPVNIRAAKLSAAERGHAEYLAKLKKPAPAGTTSKAAIVGGGPTGMAAAYFIARAGIPVTVFERTGKLGGVVRQVIPAFRISDEAIDRDAAVLEKLGADIRLNTEAPPADELKKQGYTHIFYAVGAWKAGKLDIPGNVVPVISWLKDLKAGRDVPLGHVAVIGGGNTAMDAARAALKAGAASVSVVYRRTRKYMPADAEELELALEEGVQFIELAAPKEQKDGSLIYEKLCLAEPDETGRRKPEPTGELARVDCDTVIAAVGEKVDGTVFESNGITLNAAGLPAFRTNVDGIYAGGDAMRGPATVVEGIADAQAFADAVIGAAHHYTIPVHAGVERAGALSKKGILCDSARSEGERCLNCNTVCECCVDVCPNRANVSIAMPDGSRQILHIDQMCNECGNCAVFCPYDSAPYRDKFTLFATKEGFDESESNQGFLPLGGNRILVRLDGRVFEADLSDPKNGLPAGIETLVITVLSNYGFLMP